MFIIKNAISTSDNSYIGCLPQILLCEPSIIVFITAICNFQRIIDAIRLVSLTLYLRNLIQSVYVENQTSDQLHKNTLYGSYNMTNVIIVMMMMAI